MNRLKINGGIYAVLLVLCLLCLATMVNGWMVAVAIPVLVLILVTSWRQFLPNVFPLILGYHWLQVVAYPFYINSSWDGNPDYGTTHSAEAYNYSLIGILLMALIISKVAYKKLSISEGHFEDEAAKINPKKVLVLYLGLYFVANVAGRFAFGTASLTQIFLNIALLKWIGFVLLGYICMRNKVYRVYFIVAFFMEFIAGFFSFFSSFKEVFFYTAIVLLTYVTRLSTGVLIKGSIAFMPLFFLAVIWTAVKGEYREFLNEGSRTQTVRVEQAEAFNKLYDLVSAVNENSFNEATGDLFYRLQYVFHFSKSMDMVPQYIPYQNGDVWRENIEFVVVPRFLNPAKGKLDASLKTNKFTGLEYAAADKGTSYSLGYFAECYVDFGIPGMFAAIGLIALIWAWIYRFFLLKGTHNIVVNYAIVTAFFVQFMPFEKDGIYMAGRLYTTLVVFLLLKYLLFKRVEKYITKW